MPASAIDRTQFNLLVDDDGSGTTGTVVDKNKIQVVILDPLDALFTSTTGITLNQAGGDSAIFKLQSSDVAHGMTTFATTDKYADFLKASATNGGAQLRGWSAGTTGISLVAAHTTDDTTKTAA